MLLLVLSLLLLSLSCQAAGNFPYSQLPLPPAHQPISTRQLADLSSAMDWRKMAQAARTRLMNDGDDVISCVKDTRQLLEAMLSGEQWALTFLDSTGKPPAGLALGNVNWLGSYDQCMNSSGPTFGATYCQLNLPISQQMLRIGICFPNTCNATQAANITQALLSIIPFLNHVTVLPGECKVPRSQLPWTLGAGVMFTIISIFVGLIVAATIFDIVLQHRDAKRAGTGDGQRDILVNNADVNDEIQMNGGANASNKHLQQNQPASRGLFAKLLLCFSAYTNCSKICNMQQSEGSLACIHGLRFISMSWVILGHVYAIIAPGSANVVDVMYQIGNDWTFQAVANATVSVDSFFTISGLLVTVLFLRELDKVGGRLSKFNWVMFYVHRYWRLTPPYLLVLGTYVTLSQYFYEGPLYPQTPGAIDPNCTRDWWQNALYINNLYDQSGCMSWSWYLANDMQFYVISPLFLAALAFKAPIGLGLIAAAVLGCLTVNGVHSTMAHLQPGALLSNTDFTQSYIKPWFRIGPYLVGMATGYLLHRVSKRGARLRLHWAVNAGCWLVATATALSIVYGLYNVEGGREAVSQSVSSLYNAVHRTAWGCCVAWVAFACVTGNGGWVDRLLSLPAFLPLSRLTYCAYLVHPVLMGVFMVSRQQPLVWDNLLAMFLFCACMMLSFGLALVTSLVFESPLIGLERVLRGKA